MPLRDLNLKEQKKRAINFFYYYLRMHKFYALKHQSLLQVIVIRKYYIIMEHK